MPVVKIVNMSGAEVGELTLNDKIFGADVNGAVLHAAVRTYLMNQRQGTQSTLTRTEVSGGGRKPWRQKGTGRARQGSTRSPQWTHGGVALGPKPRDYRLALNKKVRRAALFSALSDKVANGDLVVIDSIKVEEKPSTKAMVAMFKALGFEKTYTKTYKTLAVKDGHVIGRIDASIISSRSDASCCTYSCNAKYRFLFQKHFPSRQCHSPYPLYRKRPAKSTAFYMSETLVTK